VIRVLACASLALAGAGCLALGDIPLDQCGNHVVEDTEDCDLPDPDEPDTIDTCDECTWRCVPPQTSGMCADDWRYEPGRGTCCPAGYACGDDNLCHAPSGLFREAIVGRELPVDRLALAELDGDQTREVVGLSDSAVNVLALSSDGTVDGEQTVALAGGLRWATGNLEGPDDQTTELVGAFADGVIAFGAPEGNLEAFPFTTFVVPDPLIHTDRKSRVAVIPSIVPVPLIIASRTDDSCTTPDNICAMVVTAEPPGAHPPVLPCGLGRFGGEHVIGDRVATRAFAQDENLFALGLRDDQGSVACVYPVSIASFPPTSPTIGSPTLLDLPPAVDLGIPGDLVFVRLAGDPCPSLLVPLDELTSRSVGIARGQGNATACTIDPTVHPVGMSDGMVPIAVGQIDGSGGEDVVLDYAIGTITASGSPVAYTFEPWASPPRQWRSAAIGDINRDGLVDIAGAGVPDPGQEGDDVDVLRQRPPADGGGFSVSKVLTPNPIDRVRMADLDGDLYDDIVYVQDTEVDVAFGAPAGGAPVVVRASTFEQVNDLLEDPTGFDDDGIADIIVATPRGGTVLYGSFTRQLVAPLLVGDPDVPALVDSVAIGDVDGAYGPDLVTLESMFEGAGLRFALATPTRGFFTPATENAIEVPALFEILYGAGAFLGVDFVDPATQTRRPVLLAITDGVVFPPARILAYVAAFDGTTWSVVPFGSTEVGSDVPTLPSGIEEVHVTDADGNGSPELLIDFAFRGTSAIRTTWVVSLRLEEFAVAFEASELAVPGGGTCSTSAALDLDRELEGDELVGACTSGLVSLATGRSISNEVLGVDQLVAGDVTGDGVDDLVVLSEPAFGRGELAVLVQCTTRDPGPCTPLAGTK
jgi:hypothetical protein